MPGASLTPDDIASVSIEDLGTVTVVRMTGEIDASTGHVVGDPLFSCLGTTRNAVVIDLSKVEFIGSTGLNILVRAYRTAGSRTIELRIVAGTAAVLRTLAVSGLDTYLPMSRCMSDALSSVAGNADADR